MKNKTLSNEQKTDLIGNLKQRFEKNTNRHPNTNWNDVEEKLLSKPDKLWSLNEMEITGGEPDLIDFNNNELIFVDCSPETPKDRRSYCYDQKALDSRKANKPTNSVEEVAKAMAVEILSEDEYIHLQSFGEFDLKTSSWLKTPENIREKGGAIFGDRRFGRVFIYHNGAESYYAARAFRGKLVL